MSQIRELHEKWGGTPGYLRAYDELGPEFALARSLIEARVAAGLTQAQLAERMETTQSVVATAGEWARSPIYQNAAEDRPEYRHRAADQLRASGRVVAPATTVAAFPMNALGRATRFASARSGTPR